jgi:hypothetical protein
MCTSLGPRQFEGASLCTLAAQAKLLDKIQVSLGIFLSNKLKITAALANHLQQATAGCKIFFVDLKVLGKLLDALGQNANLDGGRTGVICALF